MGHNFLVTVKSKGPSHAGKVRSNVKVYEVNQINLNPFRNISFEADPRLAA